jgi:hypothetical protein
MAKRRPGKQATLFPLPSLVEPPAVQLVNQTAMKAIWTDPEDVNPNRKLAREITGFRGFDPLRKCRMRHGDASSITERHIAAADILRGLADGACIGFSPLKEHMLPVTSIVYRPVAGPPRYAERQARCWRHFVRTMAIFTRPQRELLALVVLMNIAVARVATARQVPPSRLMGEMVAILDQLEQHFASEIDRELGHSIAAPPPVLTIGQRAGGRH